MRGVLKENSWEYADVLCMFFFFTCIRTSNSHSLVSFLDFPVNVRYWAWVVALS